MKRFFLIGLVLTITATANAQIKEKEIDINHIKEIFNALGCDLFCYDLTPLLDNDYNISIYVESSDDSDNSPNGINLGLNRKLLSSLPEEKQKGFRAKMPKGEKYYKQIKDLSIYLLPKNDTTKQLSVNIRDIVKYNTPLKLKPVSNGKETVYKYHARPFNISTLNLNGKNPLVFYGSFWWDKESQRFRMCGSKVIDPQMKDELLTDVPHYYIIGIHISKATNKKMP